jgi:hypothetical protein
LHTYAKKKLEYCTPAGRPTAAYENKRPAAAAAEERRQRQLPAIDNYRLECAVMCSLHGAGDYTSIACFDLSQLLLQRLKQYNACNDKGSCKVLPCHPKVLYCQSGVLHAPMFSASSTS